jgi:hypothetical protein
MWQDRCQYGGPDNRGASACSKVERQAAFPDAELWLRVIAWPRESWLHARRFLVCQLEAPIHDARPNAKRVRPALIVYFSKRPRTLPDAFVIRHAQLGNEGMAEPSSNNITLPSQGLFVLRIICLATLKGALSLFIPEYMSSS